MKRRLSSVFAVALWLGTVGVSLPVAAQQSEAIGNQEAGTVSADSRIPPNSLPNIIVMPANNGLPLWVAAALLVGGAALAVGGGMAAAQYFRQQDEEHKRRAIGQMLATELETRLLAYEAVPTPTGAEAGVYFVSSITSLSAIDNGFRAVQALMYLLPDKLAAHVCVHYAAVQRVSDFVKGQSIAAAARMLQGNRMGGHPCPDPVSMREAHMELGAAFRGLDKLILALRSGL